MSISNASTTLNNFFEYMTVIKSMSEISETKIGGLNFDVYKIKDSVTIMIAVVGFIIIEFDETHSVEKSFGPSPNTLKFVGPNSLKLDMDTVDMFDTFMDTMIPRLEAAKDVFIF